METVKIVILSIAFLLIKYSQQQNPQNAPNIPSNINECIQQTKVTPALAQKALLEGNFTEDENLKCFLKCMFVKMEFMEESGDLRIDELKSRAPPGLTAEQVNDIMTTCDHPKGANPCEIALNLAKCMAEESVKALTG